MRLLLDQGLPRSTSTLLCEAGIDTVHVGDLGMAKADDLAILEKGQRDGRVVVTLDADFHAHIAMSGATQPSVIRIRIEGLHAEELASLLERVIQRCEKELEAGAVVSVTETHVRLRTLPGTRRVKRKRARRGRRPRQ